MSSKKKTETAKAETETVVTTEETLTSGINGIKVPIVHETVKEIPKRENVMYVGPTVIGLGIQNRVYTEIPDGAKAVLAEYPEFNNLFIDISEYPKANRMLREGTGYIFSAYTKALEYKASK